MRGVNVNKKNELRYVTQSILFHWMVTQSLVSYWRLILFQASHRDISTLEWVFPIGYCLFLSLHIDSVPSLHHSSSFRNQIHSYAQNCTPLWTQRVRKALETSINHRSLSLLAFLLVLSLVLCSQLSYKISVLWSSVDLLPSTGLVLLSLLLYTPRLVYVVPIDFTRLLFPLTQDMPPLLSEWASYRWQNTFSTYLTTTHGHILFHMESSNTFV